MPKLRSALPWLVLSAIVIALDLYTKHLVQAIAVTRNVTLSTVTCEAIDIPSLSTEPNAYQLASPWRLQDMCILQEASEQTVDHQAYH